MGVGRHAREQRTEHTGAFAVRPRWAPFRSLTRHHHLPPAFGLHPADLRRPAPAHQGPLRFARGVCGLEGAGGRGGRRRRPGRGAGRRAGRGRAALPARGHARRLRQPSEGALQPRAGAPRCGGPAAQKGARLASQQATLPPYLSIAIQLQQRCSTDTQPVFRPSRKPTLPSLSPCPVDRSILTKQRRSYPQCPWGNARHIALGCPRPPHLTCYSFLPGSCATSLFLEPPAA